MASPVLITVKQGPSSIMICPNLRVQLLLIVEFCLTHQVYFIPTGHVGPPLPCNKIKLVDVPDMNYFAKDGRGEVCRS